MLIAHSKTSKIKPLETDTYRGVCTGIFDCGTHHDEKFGTDRRQVVISFELPEERIAIEKDGTIKNLPRTISKTFTLSFHEKASLRKEVESWCNKAFSEDEARDFDIQALLGKNANLQIFKKEANGKTVNIIKSINPIGKKEKPLKPENGTTSFSFDDPDSGEVPAGTPNWIREKITTSEEWQTRSTDDPLDFNGDDGRTPGDDDE